MFPFRPAEDFFPLGKGDQALCASVDPELWFADDRWAVARARAVCDRCLSEEKCLEVALKDPELFGVWGGKTARQRDTIRKQRRSNSEPNETNDDGERATG